MSKFLENKYTMFLGVFTFLKSCVDKFTTIPALGKAIIKLEQLLSTIKITTDELNGTTSGKTTAKHQAEAVLIDALVPLAHALYSIGKGKNLPDVMETSDLSERSLRRMRDTDLAAKGATVFKLTPRFTTELTEFGYDTAKIAEVNTLIDVYTSAIGARESSVGEHSGVYETLRKLYNEVDDLLDDNLDRLMELVKTSQPQIYNQYFALRHVKQLGTVHRKEEETTAPAATNAVPATETQTK
jgi:hypothetical protein